MWIIKLWKFKIHEFKFHDPKKMCALETKIQCQNHSYPICGKLCNKRFNAAKQRNKKIEAENLQPIILSAQAMHPLKDIEFLDAQKAALLLGVSRSFIYHLINTRKLIAYNLSVGRTIILKRDIEQLFQSKLLMAPLPKKQVSKIPAMDDCYNMSELHETFKISDAAIYNLIKRNNIDKFQVGRFTYVAKKNIDSFLLNQI